MLTNILHQCILTNISTLIQSKPTQILDKKEVFDRVRTSFPVSQKEKEMKKLLVAFIAALVCMALALPAFAAPSRDGTSAIGCYTSAMGTVQFVTQDVIPVGIISPQLNTTFDSTMISDTHIVLGHAPSTAATMSFLSARSPDGANIIFAGIEPTIPSVTSSPPAAAMTSTLAFAASRLNFGETSAGSAAVALDLVTPRAWKNFANASTPATFSPYARLPTAIASTHVTSTG